MERQWKGKGEKNLFFLNVGNNSGSDFNHVRLEKEGREMMMRKHKYARLVLGLGMVCMGTIVMADRAEAASGSLLDAARESLTGDVYAQPARWRELSLGTFFTEGWDEAWVSPPAGEGGAPRQGWINASDGVFYRLGIATFGFADNFNHNGDDYTGGLTLYTPFNRRFELRTDLPFVVSNRGTRDHYLTSFGDVQLTPRFLLSETRNVTQSVNVSFRLPTGHVENFTGVASVSPDYEFWANVWKGLVLRGGVGFFVPYGGQSLNEVHARAAFTANLAAGYYFTPHDYTPFGDMVWYVSPNLAHVIDNRGPKNTTLLTLTPGFRNHLGQNWYLLGGVEVPVTEPKPFDYQLLTGLMKVF
jgi:hypothetical protein